MTVMNRKCVIGLVVLLLTGSVLLEGNGQAKISPARTFGLDIGKVETALQGRRFSVFIGDSTRDNSQPTFTVIGWDHEAWLKVNMSAREHAVTDTARLVILSGNDSVGVQVRASGALHNLYVRNHELLGWDIVLPSRPNTNTFIYTIETDGLEFFYQPPLSHVDIEAGDDRPDSIVGSYAVYHMSKTGKHVGLDRKGDTICIEDYGCGKAFHIYRPRAWDSDGDTVWCELHLDPRRGELSVTVPQDWLDRAAYPVTIDPEFGFSGTPASSSDMATYTCANIADTYSASGNETITALALYARTYSGSKDAAMAVYTVESGDPNTRLAAGVTVPVTTTIGWHETSGLSQGPLAASSDYCIAASNVDGGTIRIYYDNAAGGSYDNSGSLPEDYTESSTENRRFGLKATYTTTSGGDETSRRRRMITGGDW